MALRDRLLVDVRRKVSRSDIARGVLAHDTDDTRTISINTEDSSGDT